MPVTDWHLLIRDAVAAGVVEALAAADVVLDGGVKSSDSINTNRIDLPGVICTYGSTEGIGYGTNARDDVEYPVMVGFFTIDGDSGGTPPGCEPSLFRSIIRAKFHNQRAIVLGTPGAYLFPSVVQPVPNINDSVPIENLKTALIVNVPVRLPRGIS
jgi:hypothetical protein